MPESLASESSSIPSPNSSELSRESFKQNFRTIVPLILAEWPHLSKKNLLETEGDLEHTIANIAEQTKHTRTLVQEHLKELTMLASKKSTAMRSKAHSKVDELVHDLEDRTEQLVAEFKSEILPELENKARSNLGSSLLIALGLGFILGLMVGGKRG
jgi:ElaB/YqjD/DUF883 family membrane-anchored ribosome-binding protein